MRLIVFTDLDGTLLDHSDYSHDAAQPALDALQEHKIPLILASSKTAAEILPLHQELGLGDWPIIAENGAARIAPGAAETDRAAYARLREILATLPDDLRAPFRGFGDMSDAEVAEITGLPPAAAALARQRNFSEPGLWQGPPERLDAFLAALKAHGVTARRGGRFLTLSFGGTKAQQMAGIMADLGANTAIALGDAPNDVEMLEQADHGVIIRNDHGKGIPTLPGETAGRITRSAQPGPEGWNTAMLALLDRLGMNGRAK
ncbi:HAD-IIB family hydrolase [Salipiger abyssi]|uniref:Mannosyl-3-phosphoglycerate phosphatase n=1 Tax=Salipiger abyssi TaxID=1250539 RepID=A0A1P8UZC4_9RHOB|nr:HAD-IIB family hydrolase [Salipiger abyssi]APZ54742.1 mannosyl-3-phosphoglycerate phosphatase [Salipiger abyssi]